MGPRLFDFSRIQTTPNKSGILDSIRLWAYETKVLGLDTLEGCKAFTESADEENMQNKNHAP